MAHQSFHIVIDARMRRSSTGRYVDRLLTYLQLIDTQSRYTVLLEPDDPWKPTAKNFKPVPCHFRQFSFNPFSQIAFSRQLYKLKADLVHFTMSGQQPLFYFRRQVTTTHDLTMFKYARKGKLPAWLHWLRMKGYRLLMWQSHRKAAAILVPTHYVRDDVAKFHLFTNRKIVVTPEAADLPTPEATTPPLAYTSGEFILYVGTAFPHKNLQRLVKAFAIVQTSYPTLKLFLTGKKEYHARKLERWIQAQGVSGAVFTNRVSDAELKWLYTHGAAYIFPSLSEGFGLPGLEAMAHGCPVVSSNATCLPEVYGEAAIYFDPKDTEDIAKTIIKVLADKKLREKLIENGHHQVRRYSWKRMAEQTLAVYQQTLDQAA